MKNFVKLAFVLGFSIVSVNANPIATIISGTWTIAGAIDISSRWYGKNDSYNLLLDLDNWNMVGSCGDCPRLVPGTVQNGNALTVTNDSFDRAYNPQSRMNWAGRVSFVQAESLTIGLQETDGLFTLPRVPFSLTGHVTGTDRSLDGIVAVDSDVQGQGIVTMYGNQIEGRVWIYSSRFEFQEGNPEGFGLSGIASVPEPSGVVMLTGGILWLIFAKVLNVIQGKNQR